MAQRVPLPKEGNLLPGLQTGTFCPERRPGHDLGIWGWVEPGVWTLASCWPMGRGPCLPGPIHVTAINGTCHVRQQPLWLWLRVSSWPGSALPCHLLGRSLILYSPDPIADIWIIAGAPGCSGKSVSVLNTQALWHTHSLRHQPHSALPGGLQGPPANPFRVCSLVSLCDT